MSTVRRATRYYRRPVVEQRQRGRRTLSVHQELRQGCPCATCRALRDRGEATWPRPASPEPLAIRNAGLHGGWGLAVTWNDGHATGIYPFDALRRWHDGEAPYGPDSGLGGGAV